MSFPGPAELLFSKNDPNSFFNVFTFELEKIQKQIQQEFTGKNTVRFQLNKRTASNELAINYIVENLKRSGWKVVPQISEQEESYLDISPL